MEHELDLIKEVEGVKDIEGVVEGRSRNTRIIDLVEGDILVDNGIYQHVAEGEITVYADGTVDARRGELAEVSIEAVTEALASGATIFNMEDVG